MVDGDLQVDRLVVPGQLADVAAVVYYLLWRRQLLAIKLRNCIGNILN